MPEPLSVMTPPSYNALKNRHSKSAAALVHVLEPLLDTEDFAPGNQYLMNSLEQHLLCNSRDEGGLSGSEFPPYPASTMATKHNTRAYLVSMVHGFRLLTWSDLPDCLAIMLAEIVSAC